jgi:hypothetical protein
MIGLVGCLAMEWEVVVSKDMDVIVNNSQWLVGGCIFEGWFSWLKLDRYLIYVRQIRSWNVYGFRMLDEFLERVCRFLEKSYG